MKKLLVLVTALLFVSVAYAGTWEVGTETSYIRYKEPGVMKQTGVMNGIVGSYEHYLNDVMLRVEGKYSYGRLDYDGQLSDGTSYTIDNINDYMTEVRGLVGYDFDVFTATRLTPYLGFGYRYLYDESSKDVAGYDRESNYWYSPIGVETLTPLKNDWSAGIVVEYDLFWKGLQKSHLEDYMAGLNTLENKQKKGYGIRGSVKFQKKGEKKDYIIEPYCKYWNIKNSKTDTITYNGIPIGTGIEPKNSSTEIGLKLAIRF